MRVQIHDDNENWVRWGNLVQAWIRQTKAHPISVGELKKQLRDNDIEATVEGPDSRPVEIMQYPGSPPASLVIMLPTAEMLDARLQSVTSGRYPLPLFYDIAFAGANRANLSPEESLKLAARRIGEYSVNECC
jgi:hypothetical protein